MRPISEIGSTHLGTDRIMQSVPVAADAPGMFAPAVTNLVAAMDENTLALLRRHPGARRSRLISACLMLADLLGLTLAYLIATAGWDSRGAFGSSDELIAFLGVLPFWLLIAKLAGLYDRDTERPAHSTTDDFFGVARLVTVGVWLLFIAERLDGRTDPAVDTLFVYWLLAICLVPVTRTISRHFCRRLRAYQQNTVIVGAGDIGQLIGRKLLRHPEYGLNVVGFVDRDPRIKHADLPARLSVLGEPERLPEIIRSLAVERVVIAFSNESPRELIPLLRQLRALQVQVDLVPRLFELIGSRVTLHSIEGVPLVGLPPAQATPQTLAFKRVMDVCGAAGGLLLLAPLMGFIALRIRLESGSGSVLVQQPRLGQSLRPFNAYKFRTQHQSGESTRFARFLRETGLDELPQLLNVLRGDMSLVGPRPYSPHEVERLEFNDLERFAVPQGLTGLWQVTARGTAASGESLILDVAYVRSWSLGLDVRLLLRTPGHLVRRRPVSA